MDQKCELYTRRNARVDDGLRFWAAALVGGNRKGAVRTHRFQRSNRMGPRHTGGILRWTREDCIANDPGRIHPQEISPTWSIVRPPARRKATVATASLLGRFSKRGVGRVARPDRGEIT